MTVPATTGWLPAGITQEAEPCWHLVPVDNAPFPAGFDLHDLTHHGTRDEAVAEATRVARTVSGRRGPALNLVPERLEAACWVARAGCGHTVQGGLGGPQHFETGGEAFGEALDGTWWSVVAGRLVCPRGTGCSGIGMV